MFFILWPEVKSVSDKQIEVWFDDAVANGEIEFPEDGYNVEEKAKALHSNGVITLAASVSSKYRG